MRNNLELVLDAKARLGEGPIWHAQKRLLYWVDIENSLLHVYDPESGNDRTINVGQRVGTVVPRKRGGVMVAVEKGFAALDLDSGTVMPIADPESHTGNRFNDGKCDPAGRFWAGTMGPKKSANVYRLDPDLTVHKMIEGVGCSNGIAWSLDHKTMYYIDTTAECVVAYDYDNDTGQISNKRVSVPIPSTDHGWPDGMTLDAEGMLWIGMWDGWSVKRWNPESGKLLETLKLPAARVTACAFGGPGFGTLYITTAWTGLSDAERAKQPQAGGLFKCRPGVPGIPAPEFAG
jgi:sugar lactone lactonase YvrE